MKIYHPLIAAVALVSLSACGDSEPEVVGGGPADPMADALNNAGAVELPPMVAKSKTYRCKDGALIYVDYMSDNKTAMLKTEKEGTATALVMAEPGKPFTAEGYSLTGNGDVVEAALPGKGSQSCKS